ncbi:MAG: DNA-processing protein DprA [Bacteroidota bacterium]
MTEQLKYQIAITLVPGIGDVLAKNLIAYCGSAEAVFSEKKHKLKKIPGVGEMLAGTLQNKTIMNEVLERANHEIKFIEKENIIPLFFTDQNYPKRLKQCDDGPVMLYTKGKMNLNAERIISIVGSRRHTAYGRKICEQMIADFVPYNILVVSGLAYGIDICAHRASLKNNIPTAAVLAHGLEKIYPSDHSSTASEMLNNGGLITEFISNTQMNPEYFPRRNRIVAGLSDAVIVVEAAAKSGALITANIANSYNRDVFAVPGKVDDVLSEGCNYLIKLNKAALIRSAEDVIYFLMWEKQQQGQNNKHALQQQLFVKLSPEEEIIVNVLKEKGNIHIDALCFDAKFTTSKTATLLLNLEFSGLVKSLPGKMYSLVNR